MVRFSVDGNCRGFVIHLSFQFALLGWREILGFEYLDDMKGTPVAIGWYETEDSYLAMLAMLPASERQNPFAYNVFRAQTIAGVEELKRRGLIPYRVPIDAAAVKAWCDANNKSVCRASLSTF